MTSLIEDPVLEFSEKHVSEKGSEEGREVAEEGEGVVDDGRIVLVEVKLGLEVDDQDGCKIRNISIITVFINFFAPRHPWSTLSLFGGTPRF